MAVIRYFQNLLFCLIKLSFMRKIIIVMLIILGFASCTKNVSRQESEVFVIENVTVSPTTITFKFRGVNKPRTYAIAACQDGTGEMVYKKGDVVEIKNSRLSHISTPTIWATIVPLAVLLVIFCLIAGCLAGARLAIDS